MRMKEILNQRSELISSSKNNISSNVLFDFLEKLINKFQISDFKTLNKKLDFLIDNFASEKCYNDLESYLLDKFSQNQYFKNLINSENIKENIDYGFEENDYSLFEIYVKKLSLYNDNSIINNSEYFQVLDKVRILIEAKVDLENEKMIQLFTTKDDVHN